MGFIKGFIFFTFADYVDNTISYSYDSWCNGSDEGVFCGKYFKKITSSIASSFIPVIADKILLGSSLEGAVIAGAAFLVTSLVKEYVLGEEIVLGQIIDKLIPEKWKSHYNLLNELFFKSFIPSAFTFYLNKILNQSILKDKNSNFHKIIKEGLSLHILFKTIADVSTKLLDTFVIQGNMDNYTGYLACKSYELFDIEDYNSIKLSIVQSDKTRKEMSCFELLNDDIIQNEEPNINNINKSETENHFEDFSNIKKQSQISSSFNYQHVNDESNTSPNKKSDSSTNKENSSINEDDNIQSDWQNEESSMFEKISEYSVLACIILIIIARQRSYVKTHSITKYRF